MNKQEEILPREHSRATRTSPAAAASPALSPNRYRDAWCGEVLDDRAGSEVRVAGWVHRRRDHGGLIFIDLRDRTGITQLVFDAEIKDVHAKASGLRSEYVVAVVGTVKKREPNTINRKVATGEIEVVASELRVLNEAKTPPFSNADEEAAN